MLFNFDKFGIKITFFFFLDSTQLVPTEKEREGAEDKENGMNYNEFEQQHQKECSSTCTSIVPHIMEEDRWLALAAQDPALNSKRG